MKPLTLDDIRARLVDVRDSILDNAGFTWSRPLWTSAAVDTLNRTIDDLGKIIALAEKPHRD